MAGLNRCRNIVSRSKRHAECHSQGKAGWISTSKSSSTDALEHGGRKPKASAETKTGAKECVVLSVTAAIT